MNVLLVLGTGGLSHDPPTPQMGSVPPEVEEFLIGKGVTQALKHVMHVRLKLLLLGQKLAAGNTICRCAAKP